MKLLPVLIKKYHLGKGYLKTSVGGQRDGSVVEYLLLLKMTWVLFQAPIWPLTTVCNSSSRGSEGFW